MMPEQSYFRETQQLNQTLTIWLLVIVDILTLAPLAVGINQQVMRGQPWGNEPMGDQELLFLATFMVIVLGLMNFIIIVAKLELEVGPDGIRYRFPPILRKWRLIGKSEIQRWEVRKFRRIKDFGGWGIHFGLGQRPRSFSLWGNYGVKLYFGRRQTILIGSQRPEALRLAIKKMIEEE